MAFKALLMGSSKAAPMPKGPIPPVVVRTGERLAVPPKVDEEKPKPKPGAEHRDHDILDPTARVTAHLAPPIIGSGGAIPNEPVTQSARVSLEELIPRVVRRIAWGGDRTKGSVHLELATGEKVTVHAEGRRVRVEVLGNDDLERRIESRLRAAGIEVEGVR